MTILWLAAGGCIVFSHFCCCLSSIVVCYVSFSTCTSMICYVAVIWSCRSVWLTGLTLSRIFTFYSFATPYQLFILFAYCVLPWHALQQSDSDRSLGDDTPKPHEGKTNVNEAAASTSLDERERDEEMSYGSIGADLSVDDNVKVLSPVEKDCISSIGGWIKHHIHVCSILVNLQELFKYIARYKPKTIELDSILKPFLPDYLPAIGDLDPFLKVGRPDQERDILGLL